MIEPVLALVAGVVTIAAPCILPMLPIILGSSVGQAGRTRPLFIALGFIAAFSAVALIFGIFSSALALSQNTLRDAAIVLLTTFGVLMIWPRPFEWISMHLSGVLNRASAAGDRAGSGNAGGFVLGLTLGVVWTPCAGPVLGSILTLVATDQHLAHAAVLLLFYAIGAGIPMLAIAYGGQYASSRVRGFVRYSRRLQQGFGVVIVLTGAAMYWQYDTLFTAWLSNFHSAAKVAL